MDIKTSEGYKSQGTHFHSLDSFPHYPRSLSFSYWLIYIILSVY